MISSGDIAQWIVAGILMIGLSYGVFFIWNRRRNKQKAVAVAAGNAERVKVLEGNQATGQQTNGVVRGQ